MKRIRFVFLLTVALVGAMSVFSLTASAEAPPPGKPARDEAVAAGCCGRADGWLFRALEAVDRADLLQAFTDLEKHEGAKALLDTPEATTIRKIVATGKLPEVSLEEWRKLERSPRTRRLLRALFGELRIERLLTS